MRVKNQKQYSRTRRHMRVRRKVRGTPEKPRLCVFKSSKHIYAQVIDDVSGRTLAFASSLKIKDLKPQEKTGLKTLRAREVGKILAEKSKERGILKVVFDRGGYIYHGRIAALADEARKGGLEF